VLPEALPNESLSFKKALKEWKGSLVSVAAREVERVSDTDDNSWGTEVSTRIKKFLKKRLRLFIHLPMWLITLRVLLASTGMNITFRPQYAKLK
jgi:hypothetical protein